MVSIAGGTAELYTVESPDRIVQVGPFTEYAVADGEAQARSLLLVANRFGFSDSGMVKDFTPGGEDEHTEPGPELDSPDETIQWTPGRLTVYTCEERDRTEHGGQFSTVALAERHAREHKLRVIENDYDFADSEVVKDYTDAADAEPEPGTFGRMFCDWVAAEPGRTPAQAWGEFSARYSDNAPACAEFYAQVVRLARLAARKLGTEDGETGGGWVFSGNTSAESYARCLELDEIGDPQWHELFGPFTGPLSGEYADGRTPAGLLREVGFTATEREPDDTSEDEQAILAAYEDAYETAWRDEVLRVARVHTTPSKSTVDSEGNGK